MKKITILDCTLRDGSYAIDYQFTAEDTAIIAAALEQAGLELIEVGHGVGMNASNCGKGVAAATDEEYLEAASRVLKRAKFGMFFIPGIGREDDLKMAAKYGMGFVRVGTNITEVDESAKYVELAKKLGLRVSANLMKSYALPPAEFLKQAKKSEKFGADILVVVDSAGGMLPQDVIDYISILKENTNLPIGYHGHNNLGLAVSNTLEAVKAGAITVDASLRGMGRSAGNAQTEILVLLLEKLGYFTGIDVYKAMDIAEGVLKPLMRREQGVDAVGVTSGYAQFHSSFLTTIYKVAQRYQIDPRELIVRVSEIDRVDVSEELAEGMAKELDKERKEALTSKYIWEINLDLQKTIEPKEASVGEVAQGLAKEMLSLSKKTGKYSVFTIARSPDPKKRQASFPFIRQNSLSIIGNAEITHLDEAMEVAKAVDGLVDIILIDAEQGTSMVGEVRKIVKKSRVLTYKDEDSLVCAADSLLSQLIPQLNTTRIAILGDNGVGCKLALKLAERGAQVILWGKDESRLGKLVEGLNLILPQELPSRIWAGTHLTEASKGVSILVGILPHSPLISVEMLKVMTEKGIVIDAGIGTIRAEAIEYGIAHEFQLYRLDMRAGLSGEITTVLETSELTDKVIGAEDYDDIRIVAGGALGRKGDIVVDSISQPSRIIGVADGCGGLLGEEEKRKYQQKLIKVKAKMIERKLLTPYLGNQSQR